MKSLILAAALLAAGAAHAQTAASPPPFNFLNRPHYAAPAEAGGAAVRASQRRGALPASHHRHHPHMRVR